MSCWGVNRSANFCKRLQNCSIILICFNQELGVDPLKSLKSIQDVFQNELMNLVECIAVVRCKREYRDVYRQNVKWLSEGRTAWWPVGKDRVFGGVVVLLDSAETPRIEVWAGRSEGPDSGKVDPPRSDGRWTLQVNGPFQCLGWVQAPTITSFLGGTPGNLLTYVERDCDLDPSVPGWLLPARERPGRGFDPEKSGDRTFVQPGTYTTNGKHAEIVNSLCEWLITTQGYSDLDNILGWHDLHGYNAQGHPALFEVKTGAGNADVYGAVGQLQMYELVTGPSRKIVVLPQDQNAETIWHERLYKLNLGLITFEDTDAGYVFREPVPSERWHR